MRRRLAPVDLEPGDLRVALDDLHVGLHTSPRSLRARWPTAAGCAGSSTGSRASTGARYCARTAAPVDELVLTVLSQNTNDRNRDVAYARLRERFPPGTRCARRPLEEVEEAIRPGGLAPTKSVRIRQILDAIGDDDLRWLADAPLDEARAGALRAAGGGSQDRGVRAAVRVRPPRRAGRHPRLPRGRAARPLAAEGAARTRARRARAAVRARRRVRLRDARAADPPRAAHLRRARARAARSARCARMCPEGRRRLARA